MENAQKALGKKSLNNHPVDDETGQICPKLILKQVVNFFEQLTIVIFDECMSPQIN